MFSQSALVVLLLCLGFGSLPVAAEPIDTLSIETRDLGFYQELSLLDKRQRQQIMQFQQSSQGMSPAQRLTKRRELMVVHRKELTALEAKWHDRTNPDQLRRWQERRLDRKRRLETLQHQKTERQKSTSRAVTPIPVQDTAKAPVSPLP